MRQASITLAGLLEYDDTVLDLLELPEALEDDRETVNDNIVLDTYGLEVIYPDPDFFKQAVGSWSKKMVPVWTELEATLHYDYDPISNYDRKEHWEDSRVLDQESTNNLTHGETITSSGSMTHGEQVSTTGQQDFGETVTTSGTNDQTSENQTTGYDSNTFNALDKNIVDQDTTANEIHGGQDTTTGSETHSGTDSSTGSEAHSGTDQNAGTIDATEDTVRDGRAYGNIGVTTTQQMIEAQREVVLFNIIDRVVNDFKMRFCIMVY